MTTPAALIAPPVPLPLRARNWTHGVLGSAAHLALGLPVGLLLWLIACVAVLTTLPLLGSRSRLAPVNTLLRPLESFEAFRFATLLGVNDLAPAKAPWRGLNDQGLWRLLAYATLRVPVSVVHSIALTALVALPAAVIFTVVTDRWGGAEQPVHYWPWALPLLAAPWVLPLLARADHWLTRSLLGADLAALEGRVGVLTDSRRRTVDEAERERGRIERNLHDGAQQRLIALSILLGRTEQRLERGEMADGLAGVRDAKDETLAVIAEIRGLTQGLRPAVLESRGLDAALSSVAARLELPTTIEVRLPGRLAPSVEAALYFAIAELLTNTAKHAGARGARVDVSSIAGRVTAVVTDDGCGGADPARGSGLRGIADRLSGVDGKLAVSSPFGGPTVITLDAPCGS